MKPLFLSRPMGSNYTLGRSRKSVKPTCSFPLGDHGTSTPVLVRLNDHNDKVKIFQNAWKLSNLPAKYAIIPDLSRAERQARAKWSTRYHAEKRQGNRVFYRNNHLYINNSPAQPLPIPKPPIPHIETFICQTASNEAHSIGPDDLGRSGGTELIREIGPTASEVDAGGTGRSRGTELIPEIGPTATEEDDISDPETESEFNDAGEGTDSEAEPSKQVSNIKKSPWRKSLSKFYSKTKTSLVKTGT